MSGTNCCDDGVFAEQLAEAASDATRFSCCEREREQQEKIRAYAQTLSVSDPTAVRRRILAESVVRAPPRSSTVGEDDTESELSDSGAEADEDQVLEMLRRQRLVELRGGTEARGATSGDEEEAVCVLDELDDDVHVALRAASKAGSKVLCALIQPGFPRKEDLIECLHASSLACRVVACRLQPSSSLPARLGWRDATTVVLLLKDDTVVASVAVMEEGWREHDLVRSLEEILHRAGGTPDGNGQGGGNDESDDDSPSPCAVCGRRYMHTHVV